MIDTKRAQMLTKILQTLGVVKPTAPTLPPTETQTRAQAAKPTIHDLTDVEYQAVIDREQGLIVVDFWAEWCQPCTILSAYVHMLAQRYAETDGLLIAAVDVDENPQMAERYGVMGLPTLLFLKKGAEIDRMVGLVEYEELVARVEQWLPKAAE